MRRNQRAALHGKSVHAHQFYAKKKHDGDIKESRHFHKLSVVSWKLTAKRYFSPTVFSICGNTKIRSFFVNCSLTGKSQKVQSWRNLPTCGSGISSPDKLLPSLLTAFSSMRGKLIHCHPETLGGRGGPTQIIHPSQCR